jgi:hypothetical protein
MAMVECNERTNGTEAARAQDEAHQLLRTTPPHGTRDIRTHKQKEVNTVAMSIYGQGFYCFLSVPSPDRAVRV